MACRDLLLAIVIQFLLASFGRYYFICRAPNSMLSELEQAALGRWRRRFAARSSPVQFRLR